MNRYVYMNIYAHLCQTYYTNYQACSKNHRIMEPPPKRHCPFPWKEQPAWPAAIASRFGPLLPSLGSQLLVQHLLGISMDTPMDMSKDTSFGASIGIVMDATMDVAFDIWTGVSGDILMDMSMEIPLSTSSGCVARCEYALIYLFKHQWMHPSMSEHIYPWLHSWP